LIYSGAGDRVTTVKKIPLDYILKSMEACKWEKDIFSKEGKQYI
jgi:hypothetical protein